MTTLQEAVATRNVVALKEIMSTYDLVVKDGRIVPKTTLVRDNLLARSRFWDQRQQAGKIRLNSLYGALLNPNLRFADERLGQSTTLTGRSIVKHMNAKINEILAGTYDYTGITIQYSDTDSSYFSAAPLKEQSNFAGFDWSRESVIALYDAVANEANESFPEFMDANFHTGLERGGIIKAGRELVASKGLFIKKKKYAVLMYDKEGDRLDQDGNPGKLKAMGLDLKRADTPKFMQEFLNKLLMGLLTDVAKPVMLGWIKTFREEFTSRPAWEKGTPKKVNGLTDYSGRERQAAAIEVMTRDAPPAKVNMPGHVRASINWNTLCDREKDRYAMRISDGAKVIVCKLKPGNMLRMDSVAYPIDEPHLPEWFKALPFDGPAMEEAIVDMKIANLVGVLNWDLTSTKTHPADDFFVFGDAKPQMGHNGGPELTLDEDD